LIIVSFALHRQDDPGIGSAAGPHGTTSPSGSEPGRADRFGVGKGDAVAAQRKGGEAPSYLLPAEVAELLSVSLKTVAAGPRRASCRS
jgi:hypothetical protein